MEQRLGRGGTVKIGFVQAPQKLKDGSRKTLHPGPMIEVSLYFIFKVLLFLSFFSKSTSVANRGFE
jgi:hypothetical protein